MEMLIGSSKGRSGRSGDRSQPEVTPLTGISMDGIAQPMGMGFPPKENRKHC